ncbi:MAG: PepSY domain-containing protein, partial [Gammaproteobacteria bacterium]|nr:PepSY domain-containing protein [Gammaproteobacteria bacterium]
MRFLRSIRFWRTFHLWLSLLLSLQLLAWFGGGLIMSVLPINEVRGDHLRAPTPSIQWSQANVSPAQLKHLVHMQLPNAGLLTGVLSLKQRGELPVYQLQNGPKSQYFSAIDGSKLQPLNEKEVHQLAQQLYRGGGKLQQARLISELPIEARGLRAPVWQVTF